MAPLTPPGSVLERELRSLLIRHLPVGWEGIGIAQTAAVLDLLHRRETHRSRVPAPRAVGLDLLKDLAEAHAASATRTASGAMVCRRCRGPAGEAEGWPCPTWRAAELLGALGGPTTSSEAG